MSPSESPDQVSEAEQYAPEATLIALHETLATHIVTYGHIDEELDAYTATEAEEDKKLRAYLDDPIGSSAVLGALEDLDHPEVLIEHEHLKALAKDAVVADAALAKVFGENGGTIRGSLNNSIRRAEHSAHFSYDITDRRVITLAGFSTDVRYVRFLLIDDSGSGDSISGRRITVFVARGSSSDQIDSQTLYHFTELLGNPATGTEVSFDFDKEDQDFTKPSVPLFADDKMTDAGMAKVMQLQLGMDSITNDDSNGLRSLIVVDRKMHGK